MRSLFGFLSLSTFILLLATHHALADRRAECEPEAPIIRSQQQRQVVVPKVQPQFQMQSRAVRVAAATPPGKTTLRLSAVSQPQRTREVAYEDALRDGREQLIKRLREIKPETEYEPGLGYVAKLVRNQRTEQHYMEPPVDSVMYTTTLDIDVTPNAKEDMLRQLRLENAGSRQLGLSKWMLGAVAILTVIGSYYRLDDLSKGYYTGWLRVAAAVAVVVACVGLSYLP